VLFASLRIYINTDARVLLCRLGLFGLQGQLALRRLCGGNHWLVDLHALRVVGWADLLGCQTVGLLGILHVASAPLVGVALSNPSTRSGS
jgi:hypothetical protein